MNGRAILGLCNHLWKKTDISIKFRCDKSSDFVRKWNLEYRSSSCDNSSDSSQTADHEVDTPEENSLDVLLPPPKRQKLLDNIDECILNCRKGI